MAKKSAASIQADIIRTRIDAIQAGAHYRENRADYTPEALHRLHSNSMERQGVPAKIDALRNDIQAVTSATNTAAAATRATLLPTAAKDTASLAAEMQAQRIMSRGPIPDATTAMNTLASMDPSPVKSILVEEYLARGILSDEAIEGHLQQTSEDYAQAVTAAENAGTAAHILNNQLDFVGDYASNVDTNQPSPTQDVDVSVVPTAIIEYDITPQEN